MSKSPFPGSNVGRGLDPSLQTTGRQAVTGKASISGRFVGDAYMRPVEFARYIAIFGWLQRAAYMPPLLVH